MGEWIEVNKKLPEIDTDVLVTGIYQGNRVTIVSRLVIDDFDEDISSWVVSKDFNVTHWAYLPEPPYQKLKPCPFCGGEAILIPLENSGFRFVNCKSCQLQTKSFTNELKAIQYWNNRIK